MSAELECAVSAWVREADENAARTLMTALWPVVIRIVRRNLPFRMDEADLAQEVFIRIFRQLHRHNPAQPLAHWTARVTINVCRDHLRARAIRPELRWSDLGVAEQAAFDAAQEAVGPAVPLASDTRALLAKVFETLNADDRLVLTLLHLEEKSVEEISALTGWSRPLVKVRAFRARRKLRAAIGKLEQCKPRPISVTAQPPSRHNSQPCIRSKI